MQRISLHNILPNVFAGSDRSHSGVWLREMDFVQGERYLIKAESGTGKSSLCSFIYGYRSDYAGSIAFDGADIRSLSQQQWSEMRCRHIAYLPQELRLFPELTAMENVLLKNQLTGYKPAADIRKMFATLGIEDKVDSLVAHLSIGQQQRVAIIRTLCQPAQFIVLDEPVSHLDEANNAIVANLVAEEAAKQGAAIIATSVGNNLMINPLTEITL